MLNKECADNPVEFDGIGCVAPTALDGGGKVTQRLRAGLNCDAPLALGGVEGYEETCRIRRAQVGM